ncbi:MAG: hypothetical protein UU47_C0014G0001 [candidate division TM6 bacterium GW2011_GWE2_41_16]|nr:MAG: hypothetical protein UU47_C0014G0001 [candidate division TM6 bacterium GW2011_GWE2_41_16]
MQRIFLLRRISMKNILRIGVLYALIMSFGVHAMQFLHSPTPFEHAAFTKFRHGAQNHPKKIATTVALSVTGIIGLTYIAHKRGAGKWALAADAMLVWNALRNRRLIAGCFNKLPMQNKNRPPMLVGPAPAPALAPVPLPAPVPAIVPPVIQDQDNHIGTGPVRFPQTAIHFAVPPLDQPLVDTPVVITSPAPTPAEIAQQEANRKATQETRESTDFANRFAQALKEFAEISKNIEQDVSNIAQVQQKIQAVDTLITQKPIHCDISQLQNYDWFADRKKNIQIITQENNYIEHYKNQYKAADINKICENFWTVFAHTPQNDKYRSQHLKAIIFTLSQRLKTPAAPTIQNQSWSKTGINVSLPFFLHQEYAGLTQQDACENFPALAWNTIMRDFFAVLDTSAPQTLMPGQNDLIYIAGQPNNALSTHLRSFTQKTYSQYLQAVTNAIDTHILQYQPNHFFDQIPTNLFTPVDQQKIAKIKAANAFIESYKQLDQYLKTATPHTDQWLIGLQTLAKKYLQANNILNDMQALQPSTQTDLPTIIALQQQAQQTQQQLATDLQKNIDGITRLTTDIHGHLATQAPVNLLIELRQQLGEQLNAAQTIHTQQNAAIQQARAKLQEVTQRITIINRAQEDLNTSLQKTQTIIANPQTPFEVRKQALDQLEQEQKKASELIGPSADTQASQKFLETQKAVIPAHQAIHEATQLYEKYDLAKLFSTFWLTVFTKNNPYKEPNPYYTPARINDSLKALTHIITDRLKNSPTDAQFTPLKEQLKQKDPSLWHDGLTPHFSIPLYLYRQQQELVQNDPYKNIPEFCWPTLLRNFFTVLTQQNLTQGRNYLNITPEEFAFLFAEAQNRLPYFNELYAFALENISEQARTMVNRIITDFAHYVPDHSLDVAMTKRQSFNQLDQKNLAIIMHTNQLMEAHKNLHSILPHEITYQKLTELQTYLKQMHTELTALAQIFGTTLPPVINTFYQDAQAIYKQKEQIFGASVQNIQKDIRRVHTILSQPETTIEQIQAAQQNIARLKQQAQNMYGSATAQLVTQAQETETALGRYLYKKQRELENDRIYLQQIDALLTQIQQINAQTPMAQRIAECTQIEQSVNAAMQATQQTVNPQLIDKIRIIRQFMAQQKQLIDAYQDNNARTQENVQRPLNQLFDNVWYSLSDIIQNRDQERSVRGLKIVVSALTDIFTRNNLPTDAQFAWTPDATAPGGKRSSWYGNDQLFNGLSIPFALWIHQQKLRETDPYTQVSDLSIQSLLDKFFAALAANQTIPQHQYAQASKQDINFLLVPQNARTKYFNELKSYVTKNFMFFINTTNMPRINTNVLEYLQNPFIHDLLKVEYRELFTHAENTVLDTIRFLNTLAPVYQPLLMALAKQVPVRIYQRTLPMNEIVLEEIELALTHFVNLKNASQMFYSPAIVSTLDQEIARITTLCQQTRQEFGTFENVWKQHGNEIEMDLQQLHPEARRPYEEQLQILTALLTDAQKVFTKNIHPHFAPTQNLIAELQRRIAAKQAAQAQHPPAATTTQTPAMQVPVPQTLSALQKELTDTYGALQQNHPPEAYLDNVFTRTLQLKAQAQQINDQYSLQTIDNIFQVYIDNMIQLAQMLSQGAQTEHTIQHLLALRQKIAIGHNEMMNQAQKNTISDRVIQISTVIDGTEATFKKQKEIADAVVTFKSQFDAVLGQQPNIRIQDLTEEQKQNIFKNIKKEYRKQARLKHPDKLTVQEVAEIKEAEEILRDATKTTQEQLAAQQKKNAAEIKIKQITESCGKYTGFFEIITKYLQPIVDLYKTLDIQEIDLAPFTTKQQKRDFIGRKYQERFNLQQALGESTKELQEAHYILQELLND